MRRCRPVLSSLLLAIVSAISACGGGGGSSGEEGVPSGVDAAPVKHADPGPLPDPVTAPPPAPKPPPVVETDPIPMPTPGTADSCNAIIDRCFDLAAPTVARYKDGKTAAASYTFDDGYASSDRIAAIFERRGWRATFYLVAGSVESTTGWAFWKALADKGHEIGNHTMTHTIQMSDPALGRDVLEAEIKGAHALIERELGRRPLTFAFPWHLYTDEALEVAFKNHFSVRKLNIGDPNYAFGFFDQAHAPTLEQALSQVNRQLADMVESGGWFVAGGHGVDGDGWSPVPSQFIIDHLDYASQFSSTLWIDTYANVARYRACRPHVAPKVTAASSSKAIIRLGGDFDPALCSEPMTVAIPVREEPKGRVRVRDASGNELPARIANGKLLFDVRPGSEVTIEVSAPLQS